jgi:glycosyltransferase involved in cell wall biosynthesis
MTEHSLCSVVIPFYNEEENIDPLYQTLITAVTGLDVDWEFIFVDDGSSDNSISILQRLRATDARIKVLRFSRNFGSHAALSAGLRNAIGEAAVILSADLQDPPELIPTLLNRWREGYQVVWAVRESRADPWLKRTLASLFYRLFRAIALPNYPRQGMDFGLFDRQVLNVLNQLPEHNHFVTAMIVWAGFRQIHVPYQRRARYSGVSKWSLSKRLKAALDAIVSFSYFPIRLIIYLGLMVSTLSFIYALFIIARRLLFNLGGEGWPSVMVAVLFLGGVQLVTLGILGEYLWRVAEEVKARPLYIIAERWGFNNPKEGQK